MSFLALDQDGNPEEGLFFFEQKGYPGPRCQKASGIGFLVHPDGLVVTASHVVVALGRVPGMRITLYAATSGGPVAIDANVLFEDQWRGPKWQSWYSTTRALAIPSFIPPEEYFEDTAVLELAPDTARAARPGQHMTSEIAFDLLKAERRVLPLASPGFTSGARLKAWHVFWDGSDRHQIRSADAEFRCVEPGIQHSIRLNDDLKYLEGGYSGSALWDTERRRVVGMVRRGIKTSVPDAVLGVDARRLAAAARVDLVPDPAAGGVIAALRGAAEQLAPMRHFPLLQAMLPDQLLDLRVRMAMPRDPLAELDHSQGGAGIAALRAAVSQERVVLVAGGGGSGKTTMMIALAQDLLANPLQIGGQRIVPLYLQATDFLRIGFDLDAVLREHVLRHTAAVSPGRVLRDVLRNNDLSLLIIVDGIDELASIERAKLTGRFKSGAELAGTRVLLTARPSEELRIQNGRSTEGWLVLELAALEHDEVEALSSLLFQDSEEKARFGKMLAEIQWDRQSPTPLQVVAAASLFKSSTKWERAVDLPFLLADHLLTLGVEEDRVVRERTGRGRPGSDLQYYNFLDDILEQLAAFSLDDSPDEATILTWLGQRSEEWAQDPEGLLRFLKGETALLGGLIAWLPSVDCDDLTLRWPHRTMAEALSARGIAKRVAGQPAAGVAAVQEVLRRSGQSSAILMLAAMDRTINAAVELSLLQALDRGSANFKLTLFAIRALGAEIRTSAQLNKRLVATLVTLLLLPDNVRLGPLKCAEIFSVDDLPNPIDIARRPEIRQAVVEQLKERFSRRIAGSRRGHLSGELISVTQREAQMLDRLAMWSDIPLSLNRPSGNKATMIVPRTPAAMTVQAGSSNNSLIAAGLLSFAVRQLQDDADGFLSGFAHFLSELGPDIDRNQAGRAYVTHLFATQDRHA